MYDRLLPVRCRCCFLRGLLRLFCYGLLLFGMPLRFPIGGRRVCFPLFKKRARDDHHVRQPVERTDTVGRGEMAFS